VIFIFLLVVLVLAYVLTVIFKSIKKRETEQPATKTLVERLTSSWCWWRTTSITNLPREQEVRYAAEVSRPPEYTTDLNAQYAFGDDGYMPLNENLGPDNIGGSVYTKHSSWTLPSTFAGEFIPMNIPILDLEAISLDRALRSIPARDSLYTQILKTSKSELGFAKIGHLVTKKVLRDHQHQVLVFNRNGDAIGLINEIEIQRFIDKYIDEIGWRVVATLQSSNNKKGTFGKSLLQKSVGELPFTAQVSDDRGPKPLLENRWFVQLYAHELMGLGNEHKISLVGIYDGFGGTEAADYIARHLHVNLLRNENFKKNPYAALYEAFEQTNEGFFQIVEGNRLSDTVGCTAVLSVVRENELWFAWVGDCQAVLYRETGEYILFCESHDLNNEIERDRIEDMGVEVSEHEMLTKQVGMPPVTRAFGCLKLSSYLVAEPEIVAFDLLGNEEYLIVANNGFWSAVTHKQVSEFVYQFKGNSTGLADALIQFARGFGANDNITIAILNFNH